jgi:hypothetical protein
MTTSDSPPVTVPVQPLLGLPDLTDIVGKVLGNINVPGKAELDALKNDINPFIDSVNTVTQFADKYGSFIPGAKAVIGPLDLLNKSLQVVSSLLAHV